MSLAAFAGALILGGASVASADETTPIILGSTEANELLLNKNVDTPTLDYLKQNNILIPQKAFKYDENGNLVKENNKPVYVDGEPISAPDSAYSIVKLTEEEVASYEATAKAYRDKMVFKYTTTDTEGNLTDTYYRAELRHPELVSGSDHLGLLDRTPTLDKLLEEETQIEQKGEWNADTKTWGTAAPIQSPGSSYKLTAGTADNYAFKIDTKDKDGNVTTSDYYNIALSSPLPDTGEGVQLGTSKNIQWTKLDTAPAEGAMDTITIKYSDTASDYYKYTVNESGYTGGVHKGIIKDLGTITDPAGTYSTHTVYEGGIINNPTGSSISIENKLYQNNNVQMNVKSTTATNNYVDLFGGAIYNAGDIKNITADFVGNSITAQGEVEKTYGSIKFHIYGGAIANKGTIGNITGDFINNSMSASLSGSAPSSGFGYGACYGYGGAIYNSYGGVINNITGDFINNSTMGAGGAIYNENNSTIGNITGDFINNSAMSVGGAIYNSNNATIGNITGDFINNHLSGGTYGGVILNAGNSNIGDITGNFINNYISNGGSGGVIHNYSNSTIGNITGNFINTYSAGTLNGGAINNENNSIIGNISGDFINNNVTSSGYGAAIRNGYDSSIANISGNFINNLAGYGGAIYNNGGRISNITGDFINNSVMHEGGAIYSSGSYTIINSITGDFINNSVTDSRTYDIYGGAIYNYNYSNIGNITGDFINNSVTNSGTGKVFGGAIYNTGLIGNITGNFLGNYVSGSSGNGGAIYNDATNSSNVAIGNITGDFISNYVANSGSGNGGAIYNYTGTIGKKDEAGKVTGGIINSSFIGNYVKSETGTAQGGAIWTNSDLNIIADNGISEFTGNYVQNGSGEKDYQAIFAAVQVGTTSQSTPLGWVDTNGAVNSTLTFKALNDGKIILNDKISVETSLIPSYSWQSSSSSITINGESERVTTYKFLDGENNVTSSFKYYYDYSSISVNGKNQSLYTYYMLNPDNSNAKTYKYWYEYATVPVKETSKFVYTYHLLDENNKETGTYRCWKEDSNHVYTYHVIDNNDNEILTIKSPSSDFIPALHNPMISYGNTNNSKLVFDGDSTGYIALNNNIEGITVNEGDPTVVDVSLSNVTLHLATRDDVLDGNKLTLNSGTLSMINNTAGNANVEAVNATGNVNLNLDIDQLSGKADKIITNNTSAGTLTVHMLNFLGEDSTPGTAKVYQVIQNNSEDSTLQLALGDNIKFIPIEEFPANTDVVENLLDNIPQTVYNDEIYADKTAIELATTTTENDSLSIKRSKIYDTLALITSKNSDEERNFIFRTNDEYTLTTDLDPVTSGTLNITGMKDGSSKINLNGHSGFEVLKNEAGDSTLNLSDVTLTGAANYAIKVENSAAELNLTNTSVTNTDGTGIISNADVNLSAVGKEVEISGNTTGIEITNPDATLTLTAENNGEITLEDVITGETGYKLNITTDNTSAVNLNNEIQNADLTLNGNINFSNSANVLDNVNTLNLAGGTLNMVDDSIGVINVPKLTISGTTNFVADVNLESAEMDRITAASYGEHSGNLNVIGMNLLKDAPQDREVTEILFADNGLKDSVTSSVTEIGTNTNNPFQTTAYAPIYKYDVKYDIRNDGGYFMFSRPSAKTGNPSDAFNPAVLATPVAAQAGAMATMNQAFNYAFQNADNFMAIPYLERVALKYENQYALSPTGDATDVGNFSPLFTKNNTSSVWVKPYTSFESIGLKNGPKVDNITYGTLIGADSELTTTEKGWDRVWTGYVGYNGASQSYANVDSTQNGGLLGGTLTLYKGNFFNATTVSAGANVANNQTMYGNEDVVMLLSGVGNKSGYNFEFKEGKFIIQPSMLVSYTFVNTFDYNNAAGVKIKSDPLHAIQLSPNVKFIGNTKNGWQPYLSVGMVWNLLDKSHVTANDVRLPSMSIKPYVQYGLGVQKRFKNNCMAFGQAMIQNGGRNGISLTAGFRWSIGKDGDEKVQQPASKIRSVNAKTTITGAASPATNRTTIKQLKLK